ncbi:MAG TPA: FAD-dependent monooxygenase, partial [Streptosporangiaceae bacterium]
KLLDTWDGVEQICDPARAATFMQVTGRRYRWEFQLHDGEDEAGMITPDALGRLLEPWTGRRDLDGLEIIRSATYTFRARLASRFQAGRVFLLGDAAHLTPPFIGQGLAAGLRDADNLAWKIAHVLTGQAGEDLLATYDTERRPHARAMIKKAIRIGWAMTGGQDRAAAVRRIALAAAVHSDRVCEVIASTATPRLKTGALQQRPPLLRSRTPATVRHGGLIANPLVSIRADVPMGDGASAGEGAPVRLDAVLRGRTAVLTAGQPSAELMDLCRRHRLLLVKVSDAAGSAPGAAAGASAAGGWAEVCLDDGGGATCLQALTGGPGLTIIVRPDRVIAAVATRGRLPRLPWSVPAAPVPRASQMIPSRST